MNVLAISSLLASLVILAIGASVLLRDRTRRTYTSFAAFTFMVSAWHLCNFIAMATREPLVEWLALWPAATIPPVALRFFREFLAEPSIGGVRRPPRVSLVWTIAAYLGLLYSAVAETMSGPVHDQLYFQVPFAAYVYGSLYRCVYELYLQYKHTAGRVARTRLRYLMLGGLVAITLALTDSLDRFGVAWPTVGNVLSILYLYFLSQTLFRFRLLDVHELVGKMMVLATLVVLLWATYGLLLAWVGGGQEGIFLLNAVVASFVILVLFEPVRSRLEGSVNKWLARQQSELRGRIDDARRDLISAVDLADMVKRIMTAVAESRRLTHACIFLLDSEGTGHDLVGHFGPARPIERLDVANHRRFLDRLRGGTIEIETVERDRGIGPSNDPESQAHIEALDHIAQTMEAVGASLVVPVFGSADTEQGAWLLGLMGFRDERVDGFDLDDIDNFRRLAAQVAVTIEKTQVYERVKERDRLAAIGEMAAGLAHEIRNPLGAIKGAAQLLVGPDGKPLEPTPESAEFLSIIIEEVNRLNNVLSQFLDYARPSKNDPAQQGEVDVNDVVKRTVQLMETYEHATRVRVEVRLDELLPPVAGDAEQLRQVFLNLGLNALQAMSDGGGGTLEIVTSRRRRSRLGYGSFAEIRFRDSGVGIPREKLKNLFIPFFTTKPKGTGLGLAISQRIVAQHGGTIEVRSSPGKGSTFSVFLPALGPSLPNREDDAHAATTQRMTGFRAPREETHAAAPVAMNEAEKQQA